MSDAASPLPSPVELSEMPLETRNEILLNALREGVFDYLDFGTHKGGGLDWGLSLGGRRGLGVELNDEKVLHALRSGYYVLSYDVFKIPIDEAPIVDFAVCRHVLEHMPNIHVVALIIERLRKFVRHYIYIEQPDFSQERYLAGLGLKLQGSYLKGHACPMQTRELVKIFWDVGFDNFVVGGIRRCAGSDSQYIHRADVAPRTVGKWREGDPPKPSVKFDRPVFRDIIAVLGKHSDVDIFSVAKLCKMEEVFLESKVRLYE